MKDEENVHGKILGRVFLYAEDSELVGIENPRSEIFGLLNLEENQKENSVISMVGMGGIGKTTLAHKVYENVDVKRYINVRAWVTVSPSYNWKIVLRSMLQQFYKAAMQAAPTDLALMDEISLIGELRSFLQDKRYMVVFDDVWNVQLWNDVKNALPNNHLGSKILLTTRQETVAFTWKGSSSNNHVYKLKLLPEEKAWELFCKKAFQGDYNEQCPQWLEDISHSIADKCNGLPLALVAVGGLLSTKEKAFSEWKKFRDSLGSELERNPQLSNITRILLLSYNDLPHFLKPCLLYFGMFPEDSSIKYNRLVKLWVAEDFIRRKRGITMEDVAKEYLHELIQRSLVQVSVWYDSGRARAFRVHDLLYEVLVMKLEKMKFCHVLDKDNLQVHLRGRRLSIQEGRIDDASSSIKGECSVRSVFLFGETQESPSMWSSVLKKFYLLKVLDLQAASLNKVPEEIGDLLLLQYLSLRSTKVKSIPRSIGKLRNLQTLDLKRCPVWELPVEIGNLRNLRHFVVYQNTWHDTLKVWVIGAVTIADGAVLGGLTSLQKLADVNVAKSVGFMDQLSYFKELKYLAISNVKRENSMALCKAIEVLNKLESLNITMDYDSNEPLDLQHITSPPLQLERLYLIGPLESFPDWISKLDHLYKLRFRGSKLREIPLEKLQDLPNLTMLGINKDVYNGEQLVFQAGGFKKLKAMYFDHLLNLKSVQVQQGALPLLEALLIHRSPQLKEVPLGFQYLKRLTSLDIVEMPQEFVDGIRPSGLLHYTVEHVADIRVGYQTPTGKYIYEKL